MTVDIGAVRWEVVVVDDVRAEVRKQDPEESDAMWGCLDERKSKIYIERAEPRRQAATFFHECLHAAGLGADQEDLVLRLEHMLFPALWAQGWRPFTGEGQAPRPPKAKKSARARPR